MKTNSKTTFKLSALAAVMMAAAASSAYAANVAGVTVINTDVSNSSGTYKNSVATTDADSYGSMAVGQSNQILSTKNSSSAYGNENIVNGSDANAFGDGNDAYGTYAQAFGDGNKVYGDNSTAFGRDNHVGTEASPIALSHAFGTSNNVNATNSVAVGSSNNVNATNSVAVGSNNTVVAGANNATVIGINSTAGAANTVVIGNNASANVSSIAIGTNARSGNSNSIAMGVNSTSSNASVALGIKANATGQSSFAAANNATATGFGSTALGHESNATAIYATALGDRATASHNMSVAIGSGSETREATTEETATVGVITYTGFAGNTDAKAVVSVGSTGESIEGYTKINRQIVNVRPGNVSSTSTDAINGSQLYAVAGVVGNVANSVTNIIGGNAALDPNTGTITVTNIGGTGENTIDAAIRSINPGASTVVRSGDTNIVVNNPGKENGANVYEVSLARDLDVDSINVNNGKITNVAEGTNGTDAVNVNQLNRVRNNVNALNDKVDRNDRRARAGIAGVAAIASAPSARKDGAAMISGGIGHHRGETAFAIKASRNSDNGHWSGNLNGAVDTRGQWTVGTGLGYEW